MKLLEYLRTDEEIQKLKEEWKEKTDECFPLFNLDEFKSIKDYKNQIREMLKAL